MWRLLIPVAMLAAAYLVNYFAARSRHWIWRRSAEAAGVTDLGSSSSFGIKTRLRGRFGALRVRIERYRSSKIANGIRIEVDGLGHGAGGFVLRKESVGSAIGKFLGGSEIEIGDEPFDALAYVQGAPDVALAIMDHETRRLLRPLLEGRAAAEERRIFTSFGHGYPAEPVNPLKVGFSVADGTLRAEFPSLETPSEALRVILPVAQRLVVPEDIPGRLANNALNDVSSAGRLANLLTLAREYPDDPRTRQTLQEACTQGLGEVRLRAAMALGDEGREVLLEIASDSDTDDSRSGRALDALAGSVTCDQAKAILERSLQRQRRATTMAAARALGRIGGAEVVPPLVAALTERDVGIVAAAAAALGDSGAEEAQGALVGALASESSEVLISVAEALGHVGSAAAVPPLQELASRHPFDLALRRRSRQAIAEIQSRLVGATPGQLALAEGESGQLSLAQEDAQGWVSLDSEVPTELAEDDASSADPGPPPPRRRETE